MAEDGGALELKRALSDPYGGGVVALTDNEEIIYDILARLPVKSLMRFRCVCKPWLALIAEPYFVKKHLSYAEKRGTSELLVTLDPAQTLNCEALKNLDLEEEEEIDVEFAITKLHMQEHVSSYMHPPQFNKVTILGSCNGLVCMLLISERIMIWNPSTREFSKFLPHPPLYFNPSRYIYGFGYDSKTDDYKLVFTFRTGNGTGTESFIMTLICTLKLGSLKTFRPNLKDDVEYIRLCGRGCFLDGALHWFLKSDDDSPPRIMSFNLEEERFEEKVPLPSGDLDRFSDLLIFRGCLCLVERPEYSSSVWMMKEYGVAESWSQVVQFSASPPGPLWSLNPICILENDVVLMQMQKYDREKYRSTYTVVLMNKTTSKTAFEVASNMIFGSAIYRESLVSVGSTSFCNRKCKWSGLT